MIPGDLKCATVALILGFPVSATNYPRNATRHTTDEANWSFYHNSRSKGNTSLTEC